MFRKLFAVFLAVLVSLIPLMASAAPAQQKKCKAILYLMVVSSEPADMYDLEIRNSTDITVVNSIIVAGETKICFINTGYYSVSVVNSNEKLQFDLASVQIINGKNYLTLEPAFHKG